MYHVCRVLAHGGTIGEEWASPFSEINLLFVIFRLFPFLIDRGSVR